MNDCLPNPKAGTELEGWNLGALELKSAIGLQTWVLLENDSCKRRLEFFAPSAMSFAVHCDVTCQIIDPFGPTTFSQEQPQ